MSTPYSCILFDLDGTIVDSGPGIIASLEYTLQRYGKPVPIAETLRELIGPPLLDGLATLGFAPDERHDAIEIYRAHYRAHGLLRPPVYPGMAEWLRQQAAIGRPVSLATSKPEYAAELVLDSLDLSGAFTSITGASADESRSEKTEVVAEALRRLRAAGADLTRPLMIGDRHYDVDGAAANGVPTAFVTWGYGTADESQGAIAIVDTIRDLRRITS